MRKIAGYVVQYFKAEVPLGALVVVSLFLALSIAVNYSVAFETRFVQPPGGQFGSWPKYAAFYLTPFLLAFFAQGIAGKNLGFAVEPRFWGLALAACSLFALRQVYWPAYIGLGDLDPYWRRILANALNWTVVGVPMIWIWNRTKTPGEPLLGLKLKGLDIRPYLTMLLIMVPLIAAASFRADFLSVYPRAAAFPGATNLGWAHYLLFELVYGLDFVFIEMYFRGFVVQTFGRLYGQAAILPMAAFYVFIHFQKPPGEAASSYLGGLILGIASLRTGSIVGGILVHVGIAWMMEGFAFAQRALWR